MRRPRCDFRTAKCVLFGRGISALGSLTSRSPFTRGDAAEDLKFRPCGRSDLSPVSWANASRGKDGKEVPWEQIVKGYEHARRKESSSS